MQMQQTNKCITRKIGGILPIAIIEEFKSGKTAHVELCAKVFLFVSIHFGQSYFRWPIFQ